MLRQQWPLKVAFCVETETKRKTCCTELFKLSYILPKDLLKLPLNRFASSCNHTELMASIGNVTLLPRDNDGG